MRKLAGATAALAIAVAFAAGPLAAQENCVKVVTADWNAELLNPDPALLVTLSDVYHARMIYEPFVDADDAMQPVPVLAESWETNEDGSEWIFHVRRV